MLSGPMCEKCYGVCIPLKVSSKDGIKVKCVECGAMRWIGLATQGQRFRSARKKRLQS